MAPDKTTPLLRFYAVGASATPLLASFHPPRGGGVAPLYSQENPAKPFRVLAFDHVQGARVVANR